MSALTADGEVHPSEEAVCAKLQAPTGDPLASDAHQPDKPTEELTRPEEKAAVTGKKRKLDEIQRESDVVSEEETRLPGVDETLDCTDRTSSDDERVRQGYEPRDYADEEQQPREEASLPTEDRGGETSRVQIPFAVSFVAETLPSAEEHAELRSPVGEAVRVDASKPVEVTRAHELPEPAAATETHSGKEDEARPMVQLASEEAAEVIAVQVAKEETAEVVNGKPWNPAAAAAGEETASKTEHPHRRRKRDTRSADISQASALMLFRCSCQLLRSQALDYNVRARVMVERNAAQSLEIEKWEKKIRSLRRELHEYEDDNQMETSGAASSTELALVGSRLSSSLPRLAASEEEKRPATAIAAANEVPGCGSFGSATTVAVDPSLPPGVIAAERKLHEKLRERTQKANDYCQSLPGFIDTLDQQLARHR
ncbi:hypothetical protein BBJ28_00004661 [Nothophytophthora sp. Chile5]|nr:hypothetical protein BBJ28_00004661 [Nothophytophthora sp. Chile5]